MKTLAVGALLLVLLIPSAVAGSLRTHAGKVLCVELRGNKETIRDVKFRNTSSCKAGEQKIALPRGLRGPAGPSGAAGAPGPAGAAGPPGPPGTPATAPEYAVASVYVARGTNNPSRFALYSIAFGSPAGTTMGGDFRFSCSVAQAPCKISFGSAVISNQQGNAAIYPRLLIHKEDSPGAPITFCEYADGADNNSGIDPVQRVPTLQEAVTVMQTPQNMGIGGTLDCGSTQPPPSNGVVTEIWVPASSNGQSTAFYDVSASFAYGNP
jgi:hypothetical protein